MADPSVQSAIVAAVENDRKRFGGNTPVPATLIGLWDAKGNSFIRAFGDADLEKKVPVTPADHFRIGSNTKTFAISVLLRNYSLLNSYLLLLTFFEPRFLRIQETLNL